MNKSLKTYFNCMADLIDVRSAIASQSAENIDIGSNREIICQEFLMRHIPARFTVYLGGDIFGVRQQRSGQIDIIVARDISIMFKENHRPQFPIESVTTVISVKSKLDSNAIKNSFENFASIPQPHPDCIFTNGTTFEEHQARQPSLILFAFDGASPETFLKTANEFIGNETISMNRVPHLVIVNKKYCLELNSRDSRRIEGRLMRTVIQPENRGSPLFFMMMQIMSGLSFLDGTLLNFGPYYEEAYGPGKISKR